MTSPRRRKFFSRMRRYFISGLLVWVPIWITVIVIKFLIDILDNTLVLLPEAYRPENLIGFHIHGLGVILTLIIIFATGLFAANFVGKQFISLWDAFVARIPFIRTIHTGVKEVLNTVMKSEGNSFTKVYLIEFPSPGMWTVALQTGEGTPEIETHLKNKSLISLFVPMTPNITSGFLLIIPAENAIELNMSIEQGLKYIVSLGVMKSEIVDTKKQ